MNFSPPVSDGDFAALKTHSPFLRSLDLSRSLILTGIASIEGDLFATLLDRETREIHIVSRTVNPQGWKMVGVKGDQADLETVTAQILASGGEVFSVRYDKDQPKPVKARSSGGPGGPPGQAPSIAAQAANYREGISGDGFRGPPPPEMVEKLSKLSNKQREGLIQQMSDMRARGVSSDERREHFVRMVDSSLKEKR